MSEKKSFVKCPKCGADAHRVYDPKELEEKYKDNLGLIVELKRQFICSNIKCSYIWKISMIELTRAFINMRKNEGKTVKDIAIELNTVKMDDEKDKKDDLSYV